MTRSKIALFLLATLLSELPAHADTTRMQRVVTLLGIDDHGNSPEAKAAEAAVDRLVDTGLKNYPTLKARGADLKAAQAGVDVAQGAYIPTIRLEGSTGRSRSENLRTDIETDLQSHSGRVVLSENIWRGGQDAGRVEIAKQDEEIALIRQLNEQEFLNYNIRKAALDYNFRTLRQVIDDASAADASDLRSLAEKKFAAGQVGKIDIHLSSMRESAAKAASARGVVQAQQAYQKLLGLLGPGAAADDQENDIKSLTKRALPFPQETPVLSAEPKATLEEQSYVARQKRAEITLDQNYRRRYLPSIDFYGSWGRSNSTSWLTEQSELKSHSRQESADLQLQLTWNLWDRSQDHQIRAAAAEKASATAEVEASRFQAETESRRLQTYVGDLHRTLAFSREAYVQAGQLYDAQLKLYESGVIGMQALIDAEREKKNAISAWQENVYELQVSLLRWQALQRGFIAS